MRSAVHIIGFTTIALILLVTGIGCANIIPPTGGPKDSLPPRLISATPPDSARNVRPSRITLTFDEYVNQIQNTENIIISPTVNTLPTIESRLRNVTIKFRDTLESNTTYSINFGNAIKDVNEGNALQNFTYVFSTGNTIDVNSFSGKVLLSETGKVDSTLIVVLHRNLADSAVIKQRPRYYAKLDGAGNFTFNNLPAGQFAVYALPNDFTKRYDDSTKLFAFLNKPVVISDSTVPVLLYAYEQEKRKPSTPSTGSNTNNKSGDKRLRYVNAEGSPKDAFTPLFLDFNRKIKSFDSTKIVLADTGYKRLNNYSVKLDTNATRISIQYSWKLNARYKLIIAKDAVSDAEGITLTKNDTISFSIKKAEDYGQVRLRFTNIDLSQNPVLQIVSNDVILESVPLTSAEFKRDFFKPGEYELRILFDTNKNGKWDPGNFKLKRQPEIVKVIPRKLTIKANWENQVDISL